LEDLWSFNEEPVVRAIHACTIPVVSAVGHEIDVTLADLAADVRALTPSEAAERVVPDAAEIEARLQHLRRRLLGSLRSAAATARARLAAVANHRVLRQPKQRLHDLSRYVDELHARAGRAIAHRVERARSALAMLAGRLESLSPLAVLHRGYSLTRRLTGDALSEAGEQEPLASAAQVQPGDRIVTQLAAGQIISRVEESRPGEG